MKKKLTSAFAVVALAATTALVAPATAYAAPTCTTTAGTSTCTGTTSDGAAYSFSVPTNYNGVFFLWSHGLRANVDLPAAFGGPINKTPDVGPVKSVNENLLALGYAIGGSAFPRQGWNLDEAVKTNAELISVVKMQFPATKKVVAWGTSLGGIISQGTAEQYPSLIDAVGPLCPVAEGPVAIGSYFNDMIYGLKAFFDPTIKGGGYSKGQAGLLEALGDVQKAAAVLTFLKENVLTGAWPATASPAGKALAAAGVPSRSALLMIGLVSGIPTQSEHFDGSTGPGNPNDPTNSSYDNFAIAISPALGVLENIGSFVGSAILGRFDGEVKAGGSPIDGTGVDYSARLGDNRDTYNIALSGDGAIDGMLNVLKLSAPLRSKADAAAVANVNTYLKVTGKVTKPTISMSTVIGAIVPSGDTQWYADRYEAQYKAEQVALKAKAKKAKKKYVPSARKFAALWTQANPPTWTKFSGAAPDTSQPGPYGTTHCGFSPSQLMTVGYLLGEAAKAGKLPPINRDQLLFLDPGFINDPEFTVDLPFYFQK